MRGCFQANSPFGMHSVVSAFVAEFPMSGWVCQWKPSWIPVGESFQKAYLEEWVYTGDDSSDGQGFANFLALVQGPGNKGHISKSKLREDAPPAPRPAAQPDALPWDPVGPQGTAFFWERNEAPLPLFRPRCNFIHPRQLSPLLERLKLPFSSEEILSGFEEIVSSIGHRSVHRVGKNRPSRYLGTTYGRCSKSHRRFSGSIRKEA